MAIEPLKKGTEPVALGKRLLDGFKRVLRRIYALVSSPIGMIILLTIYSFLGAALFQMIEGAHEANEKREIRRVQTEVIDVIWNASNAIKRNEASFKILMRKELLKYEKQLQESYVEGVATDHEERVWDFWGSLFYAATIYTTIGYGNIAPATDAGRWATIIYAMLGIPLCLIVMTDIGKLLTRFVKSVWFLMRRACYGLRCLKAKLKKPKEGEEPLVVEEPGEYVVDDEFNLPIYMALIIAILYMLLGAAMYSQWEDWTYVQAFYFIFISVSTIGFGDILPDHPHYFLVSSIYILGGLSLVGMVINVVTENMSAKIDVAKGKISEVTRTIGLGVEEEPQASVPVAAPVTTTKKTN